MRYLIGVDIGTSGTKTVLFDENGNKIRSKTVEYPMYQPKNGWAEQNPEDWYNAVYETLKYVSDGIENENDKICGIIRFRIARARNYGHGFIALFVSGEKLAHRFGAFFRIAEKESFHASCQTAWICLLCRRKRGMCRVRSFLLVRLRRANAWTERWRPLQGWRGSIRTRR